MSLTFTRQGSATTVLAPVTAVETSSDEMLV